MLTTYLKGVIQLLFDPVFGINRGSFTMIKVVFSILEKNYETAKIYYNYINTFTYRLCDYAGKREGYDKISRLFHRRGILCQLRLCYEYIPFKA